MGVSKASLRGLRMNERIEKMREQAAKVQRPTIKVTPKDDTMRKLLQHPKAGGFPVDGSADWPNDRFTQRRIRDGDVTVAGEHSGGKPQHRKHEDNAA
jgi:hypothetical protein